MFNLGKNKLTSTAYLIGFLSIAASLAQSKNSTNTSEDSKTLCECPPPSLQEQLGDLFAIFGGVAASVIAIIEIYKFAQGRAEKKSADLKKDQCDMLNAAQRNCWDEVMPTLEKYKDNEKFKASYTDEQNNLYTILHYAIFHGIITRVIKGETVNILQHIITLSPDSFDPDQRVDIPYREGRLSVNYLQFAYFKRSNSDLIKALLCIEELTNSITQRIPSLNTNLLQLAAKEKNDEIYTLFLRTHLGRYKNEQEKADFINEHQNYLLHANNSSALNIFKKEVHASASNTAPEQRWKMC
jgi:hypothetical protein